MTTQIALYGSGEFTDQMLAIDRLLLSRIQNPRICIMPTAAGQESDYERWIELGTSYYDGLGYKADGLPIISRDDADSPKYSELLTQYNYFVFSGGDPGYLLDCFQNSICWQTIKKQITKGSTVIGSSAGAMVLGNKVWARVYDYQKSGQLLPWEDGLGILDFGVIPHYDQVRYKYSKIQENSIRANFPSDTKIIGIDENTAYVKFGNQSWQKLGNGNIHQLTKNV